MFKANLSTSSFEIYTYSSKRKKKEFRFPIMVFNILTFAERPYADQNKLGNDP
jgi:hypothetical protein